MHQTNPSSDYHRAGLARRLAAMFYDSLLLIALLFLISAAALVITSGNLNAHSPVFRGALLLMTFLFLAGFWTHGGQTLGMRAWRLRLQRCDGRSITWPQAMSRFVTAVFSLLLFGAGFLWILIDKDKKAWHDRFSETVIVQLPKQH